MVRERRLQLAGTLVLAALSLVLWRTAVAASQPNGPVGPAGPAGPHAVPEPFPEYDAQPVTRSSDLPLHHGGRFSDRDLARYITTYLGITNCHSMKFVFGQCYGGGMIDELADAGITCTVSAQSAARHDECSWGNSAEDYYLEALREILEMSPTLPLEEAAELARLRDPRGPYASHPANRKEHPQYHGAGPVSSTVTMTGAESFHAVLLAGNPNRARYWTGLRDWYNLLTSTMGFTDSEINVLYGDGNWPTGNDSSGTPFPADPGIPISSATRANLTRTLEEIGGLMNPNEQFFFWVSDHGGLGAVPTGDPEPGEANCAWTSAAGCQFAMTATLSSDELAMVAQGAGLEFTYQIFSEMEPPPLRVGFNNSHPQTFDPAGGPRRVTVSLDADIFKRTNRIVFTVRPDESLPTARDAQQGGSARVTDAILWLGDRNTQLSLDYPIFLPLLLRGD